MKKAIAIVCCILASLFVTVPGNAQQGVTGDTSTHRIVGKLTATDAVKRLLYIDGDSYVVADDVSLSTDKGRELDPMLLPEGSIVEITWSSQSGSRTITHIFLYERLTKVPE